MRQGRIYTCTGDPHLRVLFLAVALMLRNTWVWIHKSRFAEGSGETMSHQLELVRFKRMFDRIVFEVVGLLHNGTAVCAAQEPQAGLLTTATRLKVVLV